MVWQVDRGGRTITAALVKIAVGADEADQPDGEEARIEHQAERRDEAVQELVLKLLKARGLIIVVVIVRFLHPPAPPGDPSSPSSPATMPSSDPDEPSTSGVVQTETDQSVATARNRATLLPEDPDCNAMHEYFHLYSKYMYCIFRS